MVPLVVLVVVCLFSTSFLVSIIFPPFLEEYTDHDQRDHHGQIMEITE